MKNFMPLFFCASLAFAGWDHEAYCARLEYSYHQIGHQKRDEVPQMRSALLFLSGLGAFSYSALKGSHDFVSEAYACVKTPLNSRILFNAANSGIRKMPKAHFLLSPAILTLAVQYQKSIDRDIEKRRTEVAESIAACKKDLYR
jgi:hypothetical protein